MFCPKCGTQVPDNAQFCPGCQAPLGANPQAQQPMQAQPQQQTQPQAAPEQPKPAAPVATKPVKPIKRGNLISNLFDSRYRVLAIIALVVWLAAMGITVGSYFVARNTVMTELPAITYISSLADTELDMDDEALDEAKKDLEKAMETVDEDLSELDPEDRKTIKKMMEATLDFLDERSMGNFQVLLDMMSDSLDVLDEYKEHFDEEFTDDAREEIDDLVETMEETREILPVLNAIPMVFLGFMVFCLLFTFFGGLFKLNGLVITGMIFTILFTFLLAGILWLALSVVAHAGMITMNSLLKKRYRACRKSFA